MLRFYGAYLVGQGDGLGGGLDLRGTLAVMEMEGIPEAERPEMMERLGMLHGLMAELRGKD